MPASQNIALVKIPETRFSSLLINDESNQLCLVSGINCFIYNGSKLSICLGNYNPGFNIFCANMGGISIQWTVPNTDEYLDETAFKRLFNELYKEWREETRFDSFIGDPYHKSYNKIVQLGNRVVPYIINKLKEEPSLLFTALIRITHENPIKEENRGIVRKMAEDWIDWWEKKNNAVGCSDA